MCQEYPRNPSRTNECFHAEIATIIKYRTFSYTLSTDETERLLASPTVHAIHHILLVHSHFTRAQSLSLSLSVYTFSSFRFAVLFSFPLFLCVHVSSISFATVIMLCAMHISCSLARCRLCGLKRHRRHWYRASFSIIMP